MAEDKGKKDGKQELDSEVSFHDAKGNKVIIGGSINGYVVSVVANPKNVFKQPLSISGRISGLDRGWKGKKVLVVLLEK